MKAKVWREKKSADKYCHNDDHDDDDHHHHDASAVHQLMDTEAFLQEFGREAEAWCPSLWNKVCILVRLGVPAYATRYVFL